MKRLIMPSVGTVLWLVFFAGLAVSDWRLVLINGDGDPCLHRRIGEWMMEHRTIITRDQFSHTRLDAPLVSKEWLSEVIFAAAGKLAGWRGIVWLSAALIATTLWLLHRQLRLAGYEVLLSTGLVLVAALASSTHWLARPHLATHLLTVIFAWQLWQFDRDAISSKRLFLTLTPLMLLWANLHGAFVTGFVLIGIYFIGSRRRGVYAGLLVACLAVSLINPNGWRLHAQVLQFLRTPELAALTNEFRSPNFHSGGARGFLLELLVMAGLLLVARPRLSRTELLLLGVWGYFALHSSRNVPIFALVATPILAGHWHEYFKDRLRPAYRRVSTRIAALDQTAGGIVLALLLVVVVVRWGPAAEILADRFPVAAVNWLRAQPTAVSGEMFNDYGWGGYLMWVLPERKVFTDGRNDFYGKELVEEFKTVSEVRPGWEPVVERYRVGWTLLPPKHGLNALLALRPDWRLVYADEVAVIYARR